MAKFKQPSAELIAAIKNELPDTTQIRRAQVKTIAEKYGLPSGDEYTHFVVKCPKVRYGVFDLKRYLAKDSVTAEAPAPVEMQAITSISDEDVFVPEKIDEYVAWGFHGDVTKIIESQMFFPVYITGHSGNGKTVMIEQVCARLNRQYIRVQISPETDEDDLIGGFRLINGETVFSKGPVVKAMEAGAILLIDEIDRGSNKIMALQGVLEGKPIRIKKTNEVIKPAKGFNIIATSNTKGRGSDDGRYASATIIDEALLERFAITLEQKYPSAAVEKKIVMKHMEKYEAVNELFAENLVRWAEAVRKTYENGGVDDIIATRRLAHIVQTNAIFDNPAKSIEMCLARFDEDTRLAFVDLYKKMEVKPSNDKIDPDIRRSRKIKSLDDDEIDLTPF